MQTVAKTGYSDTDTHKRHSWIITPSLHPLPSSVIRFHHPDFYTVLQELQKPLREPHIGSRHGMSMSRVLFIF